LGLGLTCILHRLLLQTYGDGTVRFTCEENVLVPNVPKEKVEAMIQEPLFQRFQISPGMYAQYVRNT